MSFIKNGFIDCVLMAILGDIASPQSTDNSTTFFLNFLSCYGNLLITKMPAVLFYASLIRPLSLVFTLRSCQVE